MAERNITIPTINLGANHRGKKRPVLKCFQIEITNSRKFRGNNTKRNEEEAIEKNESSFIPSLKVPSSAAWPLGKML